MAVVIEMIQKSMERRSREVDLHVSFVRVFRACGEHDDVFGGVGVSDWSRRFRGVGASGDRVKGWWMRLK